MIGQTVSHYKILEKLGEGGMGVVYKGRDLKLDRLVAIKFLPSHLCADSNAKRRFIYEAKATSALDHQNIGVVYEIDETTDGKLFIVMAYYEAGTLRERIAEKPFAVKEAVDIAIQLASGLAKAHEKGFVHRDIKPGNILITKDGQAKLIDFGLAKLAGRTKLTKTGTSVGTVAYMSPEQARGEEIDGRSDVFSLGVVLYELLSGVQPFEAEHDTAVLYKILHHTPDPLTRIRPDVPLELERIVSRMLEKNPDNRYRNVDELAADLDALKDRLRVIRKRSHAVLWFMRHRTGIAIVAPGVFAVTVLALLVAQWAPWRDSDGTISNNVVQFNIDIPENHELAPCCGNSLALSPDGQRLVYVALSGDQHDLFLRRMDQLESTKIDGTVGAACPFFSPDGRWLGFAAGGKLKKVSLDDGSVFTLCETPGFGGASWGPGGEIVFTEQPGTNILLVSSSGGIPRKVELKTEEPGNASHLWPCFLPRGDAILTVVSTQTYYEPPSLAVVSLENGERKTLVEEASWPMFLPPNHIVFARMDALYAVKFDTEKLVLAGEPFRLFEALTPNDASYVSVSRNGTLVLASGLDQDVRPYWREERGYWREQRSLVWVDRSGVEEPVGAPAGPYTFPNLSPDGKRLALSVFKAKKVENWIYELDRGVFTRLTYEGNDHLPVWSPDGRRIAFSAARGSGPPNIYVMPVDGSGSPQRLTESERHQDPASWSADGRFLTIVDFIDGFNGDIWLVDFANNRELRPVLKTQFDERHAMISRDSRRMAYTTNRSGRPEVCVRSFPDGDRDVQVSINGGTDPQWSRRGHELYFWCWEDERDAGNPEPKMLMAAEIIAPTDENEIRIGTPMRLFTRNWIGHGAGRPNYDVSPDGRFVMLKPAEAREPIRRLRVMMNWLDPME